MIHKHSGRRMAAGLAVAATVAATTLAGVAAPAQATTPRHGVTATMSGHAGFSAKALAFHEGMRALWETHGQFTERAIVDAVSGNPDTSAVVARLQRNQDQIGNAVKPYYGAAAGNALAKLLHQHISTAVNAVVAAKSGNADATSKAIAAVYANGRAIARFLHAANPHHWSLAAMQNMMKVHITQVVDLAVDQIKGNYGAGIALYNTYIDHILSGMADMLSNGIIAQFPNKF